MASTLSVAAAFVPAARPARGMPCSPVTRCPADLARARTDYLASRAAIDSLAGDPAEDGRSGHDSPG